MHGFLVVKLKSSLLKFYGRHHDLINRLEHNQCPRICSVCPRYEADLVVSEVYFISSSKG
jgi:hypothetical protein